ncbi:MAG: hypothetical protein ACK4LB_09070 [Spirosomataceae bacterium]
MKEKKGNWTPGSMTLFGTAASVLAGVMTTGCQTSDQNDGVSYEEVQIQEATKGVITKLKEVEPNQYTIVEELMTETKDSAQVWIEKLDGSLQKLSLAEAQQLVSAEDQDSTQVAQRYGQNNGFGGLGSVLWWSGIGYLMGRSMSGGGFMGFYRRPEQNRSGYTGGFSGGGAYYRSAQAPDQVRQGLYQSSTTRTVSRPIASGRSGFFRSSSRSSVSS